MNIYGDVAIKTSSVQLLLKNLYFQIELIEDLDSKVINHLFTYLTSKIKNFEMWPESFVRESENKLPGCYFLITSILKRRDLIYVVFISYVEFFIFLYHSIMSFLAIC